MRTQITVYFEFSGGVCENPYDAPAPPGGAFLPRLLGARAGGGPGVRPLLDRL